MKAKSATFQPREPSVSAFCPSTDRLRSNSVAVRIAETENRRHQTGNRGNVS